MLFRSDTNVLIELIFANINSCAFELISKYLFQAFESMKYQTKIGALILLGKFKHPYDYKFESNHLLESYDKITKTIYKVKDKIISYKKDDVVISLSNMRKAYSKLLNSLTNIVVNNLKESIFHDINAYFDVYSFDQLFREYDYDQDWKLLRSEEHTSEL